MQLIEGYRKLKSRAERILDSVKVPETLTKKKEAPLPYAYPCDNYMDSILSNGLVRKTLQVFVDKYCKEQILDIKKTGQLADESNCPRFYSILKDCYSSLSVCEIPEVYITSQLKGINALSVGTDSAPVILISRKAVISLSEGELKFMIGHELGHILQKNLMCHTIKGLLDNLNSKSEILGPIVSDMVDMPLNQWYRCAEYTADRAGLICAGSIEHAKSLFERLSVSLSREPSQVSMYIELSNMHPMYSSRFDELKKYRLKQ